MTTFQKYWSLSDVKMDKWLILEKSNLTTQTVTYWLLVLCEVCFSSRKQLLCVNCGWFYIFYHYFSKQLFINWNAAKLFKYRCISYWFYFILLLSFLLQSPVPICFPILKNITFSHCKFFNSTFGGFTDIVMLSMYPLTYLQ